MTDPDVGKRKKKIVMRSDYFLKKRNEKKRKRF
jgi:hypothetical protein